MQHDGPPVVAVVAGVSASSPAPFSLWLCLARSPFVGSRSLSLAASRAFRATRPTCLALSYGGEGEGEATAESTLRRILPRGNSSDRRRRAAAGGGSDATREGGGGGSSTVEQSLHEDTDDGYFEGPRSARSGGAVAVSPGKPAECHDGGGPFDSPRMCLRRQQVRSGRLVVSPPPFVPIAAPSPPHARPLISPRHLRIKPDRLWVAQLLLSSCQSTSALLLRLLPLGCC
jgi:hypothetical protein